MKVRKSAHYWNLNTTSGEVSLAFVLLIGEFLEMGRAVDIVPIPSGIHNPINHSGGFSAKYGADGTTITPNTNITDVFDYGPQIN